MNIILITHPTFLESQSMPLFAGMLEKGLKKRGHTLIIMTASPVVSKINPVPKLKKWFGYIDQFLVFPSKLKRKLRHLPEDSIIVFTDHSLGPWVPVAASYPHVIHCHDFLAQRSALGEFPENQLGSTGKIYQALIRKGYRKGKNFLSISKKTQKDLHSFLDKKPDFSEIIYNGLNQNFCRNDAKEARRIIENKYQFDASNGFIFHIGGNGFYKNRTGVIELYTAWRLTNDSYLPLVMVGPSPTSELIAQKNNNSFSEDILFITDIPNSMVQTFYNAASLLLFPSLEEGFGWPIAEAQASGCPVITTDKAPMTEVGGEAAIYISRNNGSLKKKEWLNQGAQSIQKVITLNKENRELLIQRGILNAQRFDTEKALDMIENAYQNILKKAKVS